MYRVTAHNDDWIEVADNGTLTYSDEGVTISYEAFVETSTAPVGATPVGPYSNTAPWVPHRRIRSYFLDRGLRPTTTGHPPDEPAHGTATLRV